MLGEGTVGAHVEVARVPVLDETWTFAEREVVPGGTRRNLASVASFMDWSEGVTPEQQLVLADAQTSGGLLMAVAPDALDALMADLHATGVQWAAVIGRFTADVGRISVT
jgi:selenide,water dikinase